ncbi:hypothetical protein BLNAU_11120 [Blattamonas nauphoetae]|uniref:Uncharacterized protein n=1 Tax=Blattamonas nauphoetae TaxID=2049346 RepID=A0ABQ9XSS5_9EUKA|nr:hypothetical protein BLNAU_11120 [Blattamonas nauphoetae]
MTCHTFLTLLDYQHFFIFFTFTLLDCDLRPTLLFLLISSHHVLFKDVLALFLGVVVSFSLSNASLHPSHLITRESLTTQQGDPTLFHHSFHNYIPLRSLPHQSSPSHVTHTIHIVSLRMSQLDHQSPSLSLIPSQ